MKRVISLCIAVLLLTLGNSVAVLADSIPIVTGDTAYVKSGGYTDFSVNISGNTGLSAYMIYVECDTDIFSVEYGTNSYLVETGQGFSAGEAICNTYRNKGWVISWYCTGNVRADGELFKLRIKASENAPSGTVYPVKISYSEKNTLNGNSEPTPLKCIDGSIKIAPETAEMRIVDNEGVPGGKVNLEVKMDSNPGIAAYMVYVLCDTTVFAANYDSESGEYEVIKGDCTPGGTIICTKYGNRGYKIMWYSATETLKDGTMFVLPLNVSEEAEYGNYTIRLEKSAANITNASGATVQTITTSGTVTLKESTWGDVNVSLNEIEKTISISASPQTVSENQSISNVKIIAASYSSDGQMKDLKMQDFDFDANEEYNFTVNASDGETTVKLFVWQYNNIMPILNPYIVSVTE